VFFEKRIFLLSNWATAWECAQCTVQHENGQMGLRMKVKWKETFVWKSATSRQF